MPFFANTPESLLNQSEFTSTCRGVTSNGRPCRRPLPPPAPLPNRSSRLKPPSPSDESLFCWQHKDQAGRSAQSSPGPPIDNTPVFNQQPQPRSSIDTLADRLGIIKRHTKRLSMKRTHTYDTSRPEPKPSTVQYDYCCCFRIPIEEEYVAEPPTRPNPSPVQRPMRSSVPTTPGRQQQAVSSRPGGQGLSPPSPAAAQSSRPSTLASSSRTAGLMSLIPANTSPQTASLLMAEMAKPVSAGDEPGYIYIFWLTPESHKATTPAVDAARSMFLSPPSPLSRPSASAGGQRRPSDVVASFAARGLDVGGDDDGGDERGGRARGASKSGGGRSSSQKPGKEKTILLKIGRATNVQRRLNEWQRQCGYDLSLIRYYPYISSSASASVSPSASPAATPGAHERRRRSPSAASSPGEMPRKMPHSHKVERLVHIELAGLGLRVADREKCPACGREHREWFEVEPSRRAVRTVDEVVRRWVEWDEGRV